MFNYPIRFLYSSRAYLLSITFLYPPMFLLIPIWIFLTFLCYLYGFWILDRLGINLFRDLHHDGCVAHEFIIAAWMGTISIASVLLFISLFFPLSLLLFILLSILLIGLSFLSASVRSTIRQRFRTLSLPWLFGWFTLLVIVSFISTANMTLYDTGLYHFQLTQWLSQVGTVPGLALLHNRFGFTSSWFALAAPFNSAGLHRHTTTLTGGFALMLLITHVLACVQTIAASRGDSGDRSANWFLIIATFLCLPYVVRYRFVTSSSPDIPITFLTLEIVWLMLVIASLNTSNNAGNEAAALPGDRPALNAKTQLDSQSNLAILPVVLAAGAMTVKLSALPLTGIALMFYCFQHARFSLRNLYKGISVVALMLTPLLIVNLVSSGCPLYPSPTLCTNLSWSVGTDNAHAMSASIRDWARWVGPSPDNADDLNWLIRWIGLRKDATFLLVASLLSAIALCVSPKHSRLNGKNYVLAISLIGIIFMLYNAPDTRFGLGFLALLPSLVIASLIQSNLSLGMLLLLTFSLIFYILQPGMLDLGLVFVLSTVVLYLGFLTVWLARQEQKIIQMILLPLLLSVMVLLPHARQLLRSAPNLPRALLPPKMQIPDLVEVEAENFTYYQPVERDQCWAAPLPCSPYLVDAGIRFRDPQRGIQSGFKR